ncbi:MAG: hypothetical protein IKJ32_05680 [Clostridia bacterium]|nr:hypothetical protein [Clostridia bacterium]
MSSARLYAEVDKDVEQVKAFKYENSMDVVKSNLWNLMNSLKAKTD